MTLQTWQNHSLYVVISVICRYLPLRVLLLLFVCRLKFFLASNWRHSHHVYTVDNFLLHSIDGYLSIHAGSMSEKPGDAANRREVQGLLGEVERTLLIVVTGCIFIPFVFKRLLIAPVFAKAAVLALGSRRFQAAHETLAL